MEMENNRPWVRVLLVLLHAPEQTTHNKTMEMDNNRPLVRVLLKQKENRYE